MKKNYVAKLGALALALSLMTTGMMGSTLARYVSEVTGSATATVAGWSFKGNSSDGTTFANLDLASTVYNTADIKSDTIAPGTEGSFTIPLDGSGSDVGIDYIIKIAAADQVSLPDDLTFTVKEKDSATPIVESKTIGDLAAADIKGTIDYASGADAMKRDIVVSWSWQFGTDDTKDSNDNDHAGKTWSLNITATGKQTTPEKETAAP